VTAPEKIAAGAHYPLIVDLAATGSAPADGYFVIRRGEVRATGDQIAAFMRAKYPIDPAQITITAPPPKPKPAKHRGR
jgi:hypothetical protein